MQLERLGADMMSIGRLVCPAAGWSKARTWPGTWLRAPKAAGVGPFAAGSCHRRSSDNLHKAFKDSKLLMRDRVVWQAMGPCNLDPRCRQADRTGLLQGFRAALLYVESFKDGSDYELKAETN